MKFPISETYEFVVLAITDSGTAYEKLWTKSFDNAVEAVKSYESFRDHGTCVLDVIVLLVEPNGKSHTKVFKYPYGSEEAYGEAVTRFRTSYQPVG